MNAETFCQHFATFADAPNGIAKLRSMILQLAVLGKLVPQDPNSEPPKTVAVGEVVNFLGGYAFKSEWFQDRPGIRLVRNQNIGHGALDWSETEYLPDDRVEEFSKFELHPGDLVLSLNRPFISTGLKLAWITAADCPCLLVQRVACLRPIRDQLLPEFLYVWCNAPHFYQDAHVVPSSGVPYIATNRVEKMAMRLPLLAEQRRIVEKVDQLLGLCDELAARQAAQREKRQRLVGATLDRLVSTRNPAEFPTHAHRLRNHFDQLFDTPTTIPQLRQSILQLAVHGQLVPQDPNDEPASVALNREYQLPNGYRRKRKIVKKTPINAAEGLFPALPSSWEYAVVQDLYDQNIVIDYADGNHGSLYPRANEFGDEGVNFVSAKDINGGRVAWNGCSKLGTDRAKQLTKGWAQGGDVLLTHNATVGRVARVERDISKFLLGTSVTYYRLNEEAVDADFWYLVLMSPIWQRQLEAIMEQTTRDQVSIQKQAFFLVPIPPLFEQKRIVTKVTELLSLCDTLEAKLTQAESASTQLLSAAVHHLLSEK
jgi:type I restriction enzyme S subunit